MKYIVWILVICLCLQNPGKAQIGTPAQVKISLLTCSPGQELYSSFGHTAIRIQDSALHTDFVFNYGTFNFDQPNFYLKFIRGKLEFMLSIQPFDEFMYEYQVTERSVTEQVLALSGADKESIIAFLTKNYLPANRYYKYDFLYDNCATRIRSILFQHVHGVKLVKDIVPQGTSFRDLIYQYLDKGGQPWSKLGIDILLGSRIDKDAGSDGAMFLPDFLAMGLSNARINGNTYVTGTHKIIDVPSPVQPAGKYLPLILISLFSGIMLLIYYLGRHKKTLPLILDSLLLYITGLLGLLLLFMWFATDHQACAYNYNLLWAMPLNIIAGFFIWKSKRWLRQYFLFMTVLTAALLAFWLGLPQHFNIGLLPFCVLMLIRYGQLAKKSN